MINTTRDDIYGLSTEDAMAYINDFIENDTGSKETEESLIFVVNKDVGGNITLLSAKCSTSEDIDGLWTIRKEDFKPDHSETGEVSWADNAFEAISNNLRKIADNVIDELEKSEWVCDIEFETIDDE